jgi:pimeloyl-ACP methyl ester carboxylesterase
MIQPVSNPAPSFDHAVARIQYAQTQDDDTIHPLSQTKFWSHGEKTPRAILYLQGYTDSTHQFTPLGDLLFEHGYNVFAPRLPYHGYKDRMTRAHSQLTGSQLIEWAGTMTDISVGLGDDLTVIGLSLGGVLATWVAQHRADVDRVLIVAAAHGTSLIPTRLTLPAAQLFKRLPNLFIWWDPRVREQAGFDYTYPRFSTRTLAQAFLLGGELLEQARQNPPAARAVWVITNANDFAVSNALCNAFAASWRRHNTNQIYTFQFPRELAIPHDMMDPADPAVKPEIVFPRLLEIVGQDL